MILIWKNIWIANTKQNNKFQTYPAHIVNNFYIYAALFLRANRVIMRGEEFIKWRSDELSYVKRYTLIRQIWHPEIAAKSITIDIVLR